MQKSNLILFFRQLSKRDWREFRKFVRSPYYNQREDVTRLFDYLALAMKDLLPKALDRKIIFEQVYPTEIYNDKKLRHTTSRLLKILKRYFAQSEFEADTIKEQQYLFQSLRKKELGVFFEKELLHANSLLDKEPFRNSTFYFQKYQLGMEEVVFTMPQRKASETNFQSIADQLSISYISNLLRLSCTIQSHQTISGQAFGLNFLPEVLAYVASGGYLDTPVVALYYHGYKSIEELGKVNIEQSEQNFQALKKGIHQHWKLLPPSEIRDIYLMAINYCIKRLNAGDRKFIREAFELFRSALENKTLFEKGLFSSFTYKNITRLGMALSENDWVEQFLERYKEHLHPREREDTWRYNLAFFYFQQQKYKPAMQLLLLVDFKDVLNNLDARRMLLKSYFELGEYNALESLLDSFSRYIHRQKEMGYHRENYLNLIRFVRKIIQLEGRDKKGLSDLKNEMENTTRLAEREWLLEKVQNET